MEAFLVFVLIILVIVVLVQISSIKNSMNDIRRRVDRLSVVEKPVVVEKPAAIEKPTVIENPIVIEKPKVVEPPKVLEQPKPQPQPVPEVTFPKLQQPPKRPSFFERNPDLEKFIGENLANKIGIGILVIGIGFFVKYAIDQDWINEIGRVFIGVLCGGILLGLAHWMRKKFSAFSSVLVGGGIAVLYLTIYIAFH